MIFVKSLKMFFVSVLYSLISYLQFTAVQPNYLKKQCDSFENFNIEVGILRIKPDEKQVIVLLLIY